MVEIPRPLPQRADCLSKIYGHDLLVEKQDLVKFSDSPFRNVPLRFSVFSGNNAAKFSKKCPAGLGLSMLQFFAKRATVGTWLEPPGGPRWLCGKE